MPPAAGLLLHNFTRLLLVLLAVLPLSVATPASAQDPTDPAPIALGDITALPQPAFRSARLAGAATAVQTYQFTLTAAQAVGLGVRQQDADADLYLAEATGPERGRSEAAGTAKEWIQATLLAGTYTVRVEAREAGENQYVLRYGVSAPDADEVARLEAEQDNGDADDDDNGEDAADAADEDAADEDDDDATDDNDNDAADDNGEDADDPAPIDLGDITALPQPAFRSARLAGEAAAVQTYQFTLTAAQAVGLGVRQQDADADLYLAEATGTERGRSEAAGTAPEWIQATLLAGTYTVRVEAREAGENQYVLRYGVSAPDTDEVARLEAERDNDEDADDAAPTPPAAPTGLLSAASHTSVLLLWDAPGDDSITGYRILRRVRTDGTELAAIEEDTGSAAPTATDDTVAPETAYAYRVQARNAAGVSEPSGPAHVTTPAAPADPASAQNSVATDTAALTALYNATNGANWTDNTNWGIAPALSTWHGVTTDSDGRVTELELDGNGLSGTLPAELGDLTELASLRLNGNVYLAGPLPAGLRELSALATVDLTDTELCAPEDAAFQDWTATISFSGLICPPEPQTVIDVAVFYTPAARADAGGTAAIEAEIDLMAAETNLAYRASGVNQRLALAAVEEVAYGEDPGSHDDRLQDPSDGHMDEVHATRDQAAADLVLLIISGTFGLGGRAYEILTPANASAANAFAWMRLGRGTLIFAHELGHLMGLAHDRWTACAIGQLFADEGCSPAATAYGYGYVNQRAFDAGALTAARWRTIMAFDGQCGRFGCRELLRFSNPDRIHPDPGGNPLGVPGREPSTAVDGPADAVRTLNRTRATVANFRTPTAVTVSFGATAYTAAEGGEAATVTVNLSPAPGRPVSVPLVSVAATGATASDYTAPRSVAFAASETAQTFTVTAVDDAADDDGETVTLAFDTRVLPSGMTVGSPATATVTLTDDDTVTGGPSVSAVALTSDPGPDAIYALGDEIEATVRFDKSVTVTGAPQLGLTVGSGTRQMTHRGGGGEVLRFAYTVAEGDSDTDGLGIAADSLSGTIRDGANQAAGLTHEAVEDDAGHRVDGVRPVLQGAVVDGTVLRLTYDEALQGNIHASEAQFHAPDAFTVTTGDDTPPVVKRLSALNGPELTLVLSRPVIHGQEVTVSYTPGAWSIRDAAGTAAAAFADRSATNETPMPFYDTDHDGLIEITTLAQLDVIRHDLYGDGFPTGTGAAAYRAAFPLAFPDTHSRLRCGGECLGYELLADLDFFDTNGDGQVDTNDDTNGDGRVAADDTPWWNNGAGWEPIATGSSAWDATFEGNGHTIRHLFINRPAGDEVGLFGLVRSSFGSGSIRAVGVIEVDVTGNDRVGGLVGENRGSVTASYATGRVSGDSKVGGLVGENRGSVTASYATGRVAGDSEVGGLLGRNYSSSTITASYATGPVAGESEVGGLVGRNFSGTITASYATGRVSGDSEVGGLVGRNLGGTITASYWDTTTSGQATGSNGQGQTTTQLQTPTGYSGLYADWNVDLDGDGTNNDPWDFGETDEYPVLAVDFDGNGDTTWQEFGYQLRESPPLTVTTDTGLIVLSWDAVTPHWTAPPAVTYTVYRTTGSIVEAVAEDLPAPEYTDLAVTRGTTYTYQVAAVVNGGKATWSGLVTVTAPNQAPTFAGGTSAERSIAEHTTGNIGLPITATDPDADTRTYSLSGTDAAAFSLNPSTGQLQTAAALDYETKDTYYVTVSVTDGTSDATVDVTITVTDMNEAPAFDEESSTDRSVTENTAAGQAIGDPVAATDPDTRTPAYAALTYWLSGSDAVVFLIDADSGQVRTRESLDYESRNAYTVTVHVRDGNGTDDEDDEDDTIRVRIEVSNVDEAGLVELSSTEPQEKQTVTATLSDLDGLVAASIVWEWARSTNGNTWTTISEATSSGATTARYTPGTDDVGQYVRATASYTDGHGMGKDESATTTARVRAAPRVLLALSPPTIMEQAGVSTVTATLTPAVSVETRVTVAATAVSPAVSRDFTLRGSTLTIGAYQTSSEGTVTLTAQDNDVDGPQETKAVTVTGTVPSNSPVTAPAEVTLTITDEDTRGVTVTPTALSVNEGASADYTVVLTSQPTEAVTVTLTAPANPDVTVNRTELVFQPGSWNTAQTVTVEAAQDPGAEDEAATITHTVSGGDYAGETAAAVQVQVEDDEAASDAVVLTVNRATVAEGAGRTTVTVTGTLNGATRMEPTAVSVEVAPGTATQGTDFTADLASFPLTIAADAKSGTASFVLTPANDTIDEPNETLTVSGTVTGLTVTPATVTIADTDPAPTVRLEVADPRIREGRTTRLTARLLNGTSSAATEITVTVTAPADTFRLSADLLTIAPGETLSSSATLTAEDNDRDAPDTQVTVTGVVDNVLGVGRLEATTVTITDDDPPVVDGETTLSYTEHAPTLVVATYTATNPANVRLVWAVAGLDAATFAIDQNGVLHFDPAPDFERPQDVGEDNVYQVTVEAADETSLPGDPLTGTLAVTVTVADAPGRVELPSTAPQIGTPFTVRLDDPDEVGVVTAWCWERSLLRNFPSADPSTLQIDCDAQTTESYTPQTADLGHHLRATATYTDSDGTPNKEATKVSEVVSTSPSSSPPSSSPPSSSPPPSSPPPSSPPPPPPLPPPPPPPPPRPRPRPTGSLENPGPASFQSGIGLLSGWVCAAAVVELEINGGPRIAAAYGTDRADTAPVCGDRNNGFGLLFNWNLLGDGAQTVVAVADGVAFGRATFTVTTLGEELVTAAVGETILADFPAPGEAVRLMWQQANQNFVLAPLDGGPPPASPPHPAGGPLGSLENPGPASFQSGIGLLSGWVCAAAVVELEINGGPRIAAAYGTDRADTAPVCGDRNNGFGLLFNWNLLGDGIHTVRAVADGEEFGRATFTVTTLGVEFLQGTQGETVVEDFPSPGEAVRLVWQQAQQNFVLAPLQ